ncbi:MAG: AraC family transcriptional regulator [Ruminococcaceae bacterium]|nr:AraC family transcriptional regulator [Oscillospiraceae bacterium]
MVNIFNVKERHAVTEANTNFYFAPFVHPERRMAEHDFIYVLEGEWKIGQDEELFSLKKDSLLILGAGHLHFGVSPCSPNTKTMYFHATAKEGDLTAYRWNGSTEDEVFIESLTDCSQRESVKNIFSNIVNCKLQGEDKKANVLLDLLLCELSQKDSAEKNESVASKIKTIIHGSPEKIFSNRTLASMTSVSVKTAENKFREQFGVTIHQYVLAFKAEQAVAYFRNFPDMTVKEVAYNLGFYDEYHFSKQFKKVKNISPSAYKKQLLSPENP